MAQIQQFLDIQLNWEFEKERYKIFQMVRFDIFKIDTDTLNLKFRQVCKLQ